MMLCGTVILIWYSVVQARADIAFRKNDIAEAQEAVRLAPGNASYHALLAELLEASGANPDSELKVATDLSPSESRYWIRRAFRAEVEQQYDDSERFLKDAYRVDRGFDPRWALMNYYFRRGRFSEFWKSGAEAFAMSYGDPTPIFRLCLAANNDPIYTRQILPERREILVSFFGYLISHEEIGAASQWNWPPALQQKTFRHCCNTVTSK
jgi:tetratricopeptide (TPR) repeat protein